MKLFLISILLFSSFCVLSEVKIINGKKVQIIYQKRQKIELGALVVDGEIVSPGDFSIDNEKETATKLLFKRKNYNDRLRINIQYVF